ncbi:MAG: T9SS type A sorting domain-containing protein [Crocinitomicaceae bacterium]|nr:T9SS type A sorting domain-containing protein [Crocinitomicaceae bacterium]
MRFQSSVTLSLFLLLFGFNSIAQNLVKNPYFDSIPATCPCDGTFSLVMGTEIAKHWYTPNRGSSDFYHSCTVAPCNNIIPNVWQGHQLPFFGDGYAGIMLRSTMFLEYAEYIQTQLISPLEEDSTYCVEFYVNLGDSSGLAISQIGLYFSNDSLVQNNFDPFLVTPQIVSPPGAYLTNTSGWTKISGEFLALGGEEYITIGRFKPKDSLQIMPSNLSASNTFLTQSYYHVDGVSVLKTGANDCDHTSSLFESVTVGNIVIYPNPTTGIFNVSGAIGNIEVFDFFGRLVLTSTTSEINMSDQPKGIYFIRVEDFVKKICVQ